MVRNINFLRIEIFVILFCLSLPAIVIGQWICVTQNLPELHLPYEMDAISADIAVIPVTAQLYLARIKAGKYAQTRKLVLQR